MFINFKWNFLIRFDQDKSGYFDRIIRCIRPRIRLNKTNGKSDPLWSIRSDPIRSILIRFDSIHSDPFDPIHSGLIRSFWFCRSFEQPDGDKTREQEMRQRYNLPRVAGLMRPFPDTSTGSIYNTLTLNEVNSEGIRQQIISYCKHTAMGIR